MGTVEGEQQVYIEVTGSSNEMSSTNSVVEAGTGNKSAVVQTLGGTAVFSLMSTKAETKIVRAFVKEAGAGVEITNPAADKSITFTAEAAAKEKTTVSAQPDKLEADGKAESMITVFAKDKYGNNVPGQSVYITVEPISGVQIKGVNPQVTNASGQAQFSVSSTEKGIKTVKGYLGINSSAEKIEQEAVVTWT